LHHALVDEKPDAHAAEAHASSGFKEAKISSSLLKNPLATEEA